MFAGQSAYKSPVKPCEFEIKVFWHLQMLAREMLQSEYKVSSKSFEFEIKIFLHLEML